MQPFKPKTESKGKKLPLEKAKKGPLHDSMLPKEIKSPEGIGSTDPHKNLATGRM